MGQELSETRQHKENIPEIEKLGKGRSGRVRGRPYAITPTQG